MLKSVRECQAHSGEAEVHYLPCPEEHFAHVTAPGSICCMKKGCGAQPMCVMFQVPGEHQCLCLLPSEQGLPMPYQK